MYDVLGWILCIFKNEPVRYGALPRISCPTSLELICLVSGRNQSTFARCVVKINEPFHSKALGLTNVLMIDPGLAGSTDTGRGPREQKMLKGHLLRVVHHQAY
jgi:hypothetical protein